jgi:hypothetical protein
MNLKLVLASIAIIVTIENPLFSQKTNNYLVSINPETGKMQATSHSDTLYSGNFPYSVVRLRIGDGSFNPLKTNLWKVKPDKYFMKPVSKGSEIYYAYAIIDSLGNPIHKEIFTHIDIWGNGKGIAYCMKPSFDKYSPAHKVKSYYVDLNRGQAHLLTYPNGYFIIGCNTVYCVYKDTIFTYPSTVQVEKYSEYYRLNSSYTFSKQDMGYQFGDGLHFFGNVMEGDYGYKEYLHWMNVPVKISKGLSDQFEFERDENSRIKYDLSQEFLSMSNFNNLFDPAFFVSRRLADYKDKKSLSTIFYNREGGLLFKEKGIEIVDYKFGNFVAHNSIGNKKGTYFIMSGEGENITPPIYKAYYPFINDFFVFTDNENGFVSYDSTIVIANDSVTEINSKIVVDYLGILDKEKVAIEKRLQQQKARSAKREILLKQSYNVSDVLPAGYGYITIIRAPGAKTGNISVLNYQGITVGTLLSGKGLYTNCGCKPEVFLNDPDYIEKKDREDWEKEIKELQRIKVPYGNYKLYQLVDSYSATSNKTVMVNNYENTTEVTKKKLIEVTVDATSRCVVVEW